ncbi:hypothetical protein M378DRAFT_180486 [Amanita muscaria Koide BX008]|uniref:Uncharacterized protein n=1 Tax=Amanita muscaria (strain Koide BX008) TaxID=946122 RepID=A0A0C2WVL5_AMAMK|nr:hypothetical protein M378DRAFT_180486 [Amanita muscaria Koide BX008]
MNSASPHDQSLENNSIIKNGISKFSTYNTFNPLKPSKNCIYQTLYATFIRMSHQFNATSSFEKDLPPRMRIPLHMAYQFPISTSISIPSHSWQSAVPPQLYNRSIAQRAGQQHASSLPPTSREA